MTEKVGILLLAYGTPASLADVEAYYTHIRRGRAPSPEQLAELTGRYRAIGGSSPLLAITRAQARGLQRTLQRQSPDREFTVVLGMKHASPFIEDGVAALSERSVDTAVGLVLAPHFSTMSVGEYLGRVRAATETCGGPEVSFIRDWHLESSYIAMLADRVRAALAQLQASGGDRPHVIFTAHSLPRRILMDGDPYPTQVEDTARAVAEAVGLEDWSVAWQSAGRTSEQWLGPDVSEVVRELGTTDRNAVLVCPAGFVSDHLEILYDLDIQCRRAAEAAGLRFARTASPNDDPEFLEVLARVAGSQLKVAAV